MLEVKHCCEASTGPRCVMGRSNSELIQQLIECCQQKEDIFPLG
jgi:hypothetical protein